MSPILKMQLNRAGGFPRGGGGRGGEEFGRASFFSPWHETSILVKPRNKS